MKLRYMIIGGIAFIVSWNVFLIHRDQQMFDSYNRCLPADQCLK